MAQKLERLEQALTRDRAPIAFAGYPSLQSEPELRKALNINQAYQRELGASLSEHVQNFFDQCQEGLTGAVLQKKLLWPEDLGFQDVSRDCVDLVVVVGLLAPEASTTSDRPCERAVGYCAQFLEGGRRTIVFKNYGSQLKLDHMQLGFGTKKARRDLAGELCAVMISRHHSSNCCTRQLS